MAYKIPISQTLSSFDLKDRNYYEKLNDVEQKELSPFTMIRWGASLIGNFEMEVCQLIRVNTFLNTHFFDISTKDHKKFQWLLATTVSPGEGRQQYKWLGAKKKDKVNSNVEKVLEELFPHLKPDDIKLLAKINDKNDIKLLARKHGWTDERIRKDL